MYNLHRNVYYPQISEVGKSNHTVHYWLKTIPIILSGEIVLNIFDKGLRTHDFFPEAR